MPAMAPAGAHHSWEADSSSDSDAPQDAKPSSGAEFVAYLTSMYIARDVSARDFCSLMFLAGKAGVKEAVPLGHNPSAPSGHFNRHLKKALPFLRDTSALYDFVVPSCTDTGLARGEHTTHGIPAHEAIDESLSSQTDWANNLRNALTDGFLPPVYHEHPVVLNNPGVLVYPVSLFVDGVPYSHIDSVVGFWLVDEVTGKRHLLSALRKKLMCVCGCRGWCTFFGLFSWLAWSVAAMAEGTFPSTRHDHKAWRATDASRERRSGSPMQCRFCVLYIKGDWAEYASTFGFPTWNDSLRPCFACNASLRNLYRIEGITPVGLFWRTNRDGDYFASCRRCEAHVVIDKRMHRDIVSLLEHDRRQGGNRGRCMRADYSPAGLVQGDRLEPSRFLPDPGNFEGITQFPMPVVFWRRSLETMSRHRNPIFQADLGVTPMRSLTIDALHAVFLGVMLAFAKHALWFMLEQGVWAKRATTDETVEVSALVITSQLRGFYRKRHEQNPAEMLTRVSSFGQKTIGAWHDRKLRTKGAETWGVLLFLVEALRANKARLGQDGQRLFVAGQSLKELIELWQMCGATMTVAQVQNSFDMWLRHLRCTEGMPDLEIPKRHLVTHLLGNMAFQGCPHRYSNWLDESLNKTLKQFCRGVAQKTFEPFLLLRMREHLRAKGAKRSASAM